ncbi:hypothetical protein RIF29_36226 [Crotalaria pallida]|uniref:Uncharacterized protein n=1 Tax=Crotalaria pallida TaxID=3830 RepID=A0AAN9HVM4_CROPI
MAVFTSFLVHYVPLSPPAITLTSTALCSPPSLSPSLRVKPISINTFTTTASLTHTHKYVYPHPCPHFAESETQKFKAELLDKLLENNDEFGDDLDAVIDVCAQIFREFLHKEYGGPGTLLVEPFTDMLVALKKKKLSGAPLAARASLLWAQNYVDKDWEVWNSKLK